VKLAIVAPVTKPTFREPERVEQPPCGDLLDYGRGRREHEHRRVLVPGAGQPISRQGGRHPAAHDEPEVARPGRPDQARLDPPRERLDHRERVLAGHREWSAERIPQLGQVHGLRNRPVGQALEEAPCQLGGPAEQCVAIIHGVDRHCG
jgi:hypothetical protein